MNLKYTSVRAGVSQSEREVLDVMSRLGKTVIYAKDLENELGFGKAASNLMLSRLYKKSWIQRLRSGVYRIIPFGSDNTDPMPEDAWAIAVELFSPCYISGWTAAEHWELTEQIFNSTVVFTTQKQRQKEQVIAGLKYRTKLILPQNMFGTQKIWSSNQPIQIADLHRTVIDVLDDPEIGGGGRHVLDIVKSYFRNKQANPETLYQYAEKLGRGAVFKRLGFIAENLELFSPLLVEKLHTHIKAGVINFDPHGPSLGSIISKWGIRMNIPLEDVG